MSSRLAIPRVTPVEQGRWSLLRWLAMIGLVLGAQLTLVFWFGDRTLVHPRKPGPPPPALGIAGPVAQEMVELTDPTLFVLPHWQGFSGLAWLESPPLPNQPFSWSEPPNLLALDEEDLGATFHQFIQTNLPLVFSPIAQAPPGLTQPNVAESAGLPDRSTLRLSASLAGRHLHQTPELPSFPHNDLLTNSVVQLLVDAQGNPLSFTLLSASGSAAADQLALETARAAKFDSISRGGPERSTNPLAGLTWGEMVFEWRTAPMVQTNGP
jgi:TonB family protein